MPAPLSVIVPTLNAAPGLRGLSASLAEGLEAGLVSDLVVSDGGSTDGTVALAEALGARVVAGPASRGAQIARGVHVARRTWLMVLHADTELTPGWAQAVCDHMVHHPHKAGYFHLAFRAKGPAPRIVAGWANGRSRVLGLPYGDQGLVISRKLLDDVGGVPELALMEDVALARALKGRLRALPATATTSAARYETEGWMRRSFRNGTTLARYFLGASPEELRRWYSRSD